MFASRPSTLRKNVPVKNDLLIIVVCSCLSLVHGVRFDLFFTQFSASSPNKRQNGKLYKKERFNTITKLTCKTPLLFQCFLWYLCS